MIKQKTWKDHLNDVIRDVFFTDEELLDYMLIPTEDKDNIVKFIDKYMIRSATPDEILTNEKVRVSYCELQSYSIGMNMTRKLLIFDVYVKDEYLHDVDDDMLKFRTDVICQKIKELLTTKKYTCDINFNYSDDYDLYTKLIGYTRHRITFNYKISF